MGEGKTCAEIARALHLARSTVTLRAPGAGWPALRAGVLLCWLLAGSARAQSLAPRVTGDVEQSRPFAVSPTVSLGGSILEFDYSGDHAFRGIVLRGGVALGPIGEVTVGGEHWPDLGRYAAGWAAQAEAAFYPLGRRRVSPYLLFHLGHFQATPAPGSTRNRGVSGRSTGLALGVHARVWDPLGVRLEGVIRYDGGAGDDEVRALVVYAPGLAKAGSVGAEGAAVVYGMVRASGPWRFVEPGYAVKTATRVTERDAAALTLALVHWQIPGSGPVGSYLWDTRAVLLMPAWRRGTFDGRLRWYVQAGPTVSLMLEGPDNGLRGGANAELGGSLRLGPLPRMTGGIGWVWIVRGASDPRATADDQHALLLHAGLAF
jgi:hypothetical protein